MSLVRMLGSVLVLGVSSSAMAAAPGTLSFKTVVNGEPVTAGCTLDAWPAGMRNVDKDAALEPTASGDAHSGVELPPGSWDALVHCPSERGEIASLARGVSIKSGKPATPSISMENAALIVHGNNNANRVKGDVTAYFAGTTLQAATAQTSNRMEVAAGTYDIRIVGEVDGEQCTVQVAAHVVKPGRPSPLQVDMSAGMVKLTVLRNGKPAEGGGAVTFTGQVNRIKEFAAGEAVPLAPGTYDVLGSLSSSFDFAEKRERKVTITPGKVTQVTVDLPRGSMSTMCELDKREAPATIYGYLPGATEHFNTAECGQTLELSPGKYNFKTVLDADKAGYRVLGGAKAPEVWQRDVVIQKGKQVSLTADFSPARIKVLARRNGVLADAAVTLTISGGATAGGGPAWEELPVQPGRYDVEVIFPGKKAPTRQLVRGVACKAKAVCTVDVNLEYAQLTVEVFKGGQTQPTAEVLLYKGGAEVPYARGASGEALEVPPGEYVPEVRVDGSKKRFSAMRLRAGEPEVRKVEVE